MLFDDIENAYDEIANLYSEWEEFPQPFERLLKLRRQYNELAPDWTQAEEWAQWYTVGATGRGIWWDEEPVIDGLHWSSPMSSSMYAPKVDLPIGIDWRLCKWKRP